MHDEARVTERAATRWDKGHPWIYASDVTRGPSEPGVVAVTGPNGRYLGLALHSPASEIRLRLLERRPDARIDLAWWGQRIQQALGRRASIDATAYRVVHGEGDGLPSLIVDRYDQWAVVQLLSAGLESRRAEVLDAVGSVLGSRGIVLRHDAAIRRREGLTQEVVVARGEVPDEITVREGAVRYLVAPRTGQKTGAFLDQRPHRLRAGALMPKGGRALDCFSYHGAFALHLAARAGSVLALDASADALARGARSAELNGYRNIQWREADAFAALRELNRAGLRFDLVVVDPPAFARSRDALPRALAGYKEINLRAMRLVEPGGRLFTASCSFHLRWPDFLAMLADAARDSGRRVVMQEHLVQGVDHPEVLTIPETAYLKGAVLGVEEERGGGSPLLTTHCPSYTSPPHHQPSC
jgi:23S rRNA (cytosine1962-C5)-methyltransferase